MTETYKLIFQHNSITKIQLEELLSKYTKDFSVANFYPEMKIGCNTITFAIVDFPQAILTSLWKESIIKNIDAMFTTKRISLTAECCSTTGCGCKS